MTDDAALQPIVASEYLALAADLSTIDDGAWDTPSLCEGWRVREVIAHLTMPARYDADSFMAELQARDFDFDRLSNEIAARDGDLPTAKLLGDLRDDGLHKWIPTGGDYHRALSHVVIHGLDATVPLGRTAPARPDATRIVLDTLAGGASARFGMDLAGRRLEACDLDWSHGTGARLRGRAGDLVLAMAGRTLPAGRMEGPPL